MKRFIKIISFIAVVCLLSGFLIGGITKLFVGDRYNSRAVWTLNPLHTVRNSIFGWARGRDGYLTDRFDFPDSIEDIDDVLKEIDDTLKDIGMTSATGVLPGGSYDYAYADVEQLEVSASAARVLIVRGISEGGGDGNIDRTVRVTLSSKDIRVEPKMSGKTLKLEFKRAPGIVNLPTDAYAMITIPYGIEFSKVNLKAGAGSIEVESLEAGKMELTAEAGAIDAEYLKAEEMELTAEAGAININYAEAPDMGMDVDVGAVTVEYGLSDRLEVSASLGAVSYTGDVNQSLKAKNELGDVELNIAGKDTDFNYQIENDVGKIYIGRDSYTSHESSRRVNHDGALKNASLDNEVGSITLKFYQQD